MQPDPLISEIVTNPYAYANNNPVFYVDMDGESYFGAYLLPFFRIGGELGVSRATGLAGLTGMPAISMLGEAIGGSECAASGAGSSSIAGAGSPGDPEDGDEEAKGGVYALLDKDGKVMRTGRTKNHANREAQHRRTFPHYRYMAVHRTNSYNAQRGLEQMLHKTHNPPLNRISPIWRFNPKYDDYMRAAESFLNGIR